MSYVSANLNPGESIVYQTSLHPVVYAYAAAFGVAALPFFASGDTAGAGVFLLAVALVAFGAAWIRINSSEFAVTTTRLITKTGLITHRTIELQLSKIEAVAV